MKTQIRSRTILTISLTTAKLLITYYNVQYFALTNIGCVMSQLINNFKTQRTSGFQYFLYIKLFDVINYHKNVKYRIAPQSTLEDTY